MPAEYAEAALVTGGPAAISGQMARLAAGGAARVVVTFAAGDWFRQAELLAEAASLLGS